MISRDELMHHRLQAWLRENESDNLEYLGKKPDVCGVMHWYRVGQHSVTVDCIEGIDFADAESDTIRPTKHIFL